MNPQFSIVTPCFNSRAVLPRCVGSIRGQKNATFEHMVQDGGSSDGTREVLKHVARLWGFPVHLESVNGQGEVTQRWSVTAP